MARIHEWKETDHWIQIYASGRAAVVTYFFRITFEIDGKVPTKTGRDMFLLVVADQFSLDLSAACS